MPIRVENNRAKLEKKMKDKPKMGHKPKMAHRDKPKSAGLKALAAKNPELEYVGKAKMMDVRAKMAMPKMVDGKNFPKMAQDMAGALIPKMDHAKMYKPTKYHDGPMMYGKPKMEDPKIKTEKLAEVDLGTVKKRDGSVKNPFYGSSPRNFINKSSGKSLAFGSGEGSSVGTFRNMLNQKTVPAGQLARFKKQFKRK